MNEKITEKISESLSAVIPITVIVLLLSILVVPLEIGAISLFLIGAVLIIIGMSFFQLGSEMAMCPLGEGIGIQMSKLKSIFLIFGISFLMGAIITLAEPDLQVLATQVPAIPNRTLIFTIAIGVGIFLAAAVLRILFRFDLSLLLILLYGLLLVLAMFVSKNFLAVAFDSGGVTTGPITVPFIMTMGIGIYTIRADKDAGSDSFGLVALSSVGPILAVMLLGFFHKADGISEQGAQLLNIHTTRDAVMAFLIMIPLYAKEVAISILPLIMIFWIFQAIFHCYHRRQRIRIMVGFFYTYIGLVLFLCGVNVGFSPVGTLLGKEIAALEYKWLLVPIGMLIGYFIVKAEPAIQVLNHQVNNVTNGIVSEKSMNLCLSIGVSVSTGLSLLRVLTGIPIAYFLFPGYIIALLMTRFVPKIFVGIAFDSGGVASGPMTSTFLLPLSIGACETLNGNIMSDAFGVVAMVAMTPLIAIQIMGLIYQFKVNRQQRFEKSSSLPDADCDEIIFFTEA